MYQYQGERKISNQITNPLLLHSWNGILSLKIFRLLSNTLQLREIPHVRKHISAPSITNSDEEEDDMEGLHYLAASDGGRVPPGFLFLSTGTTAGAPQGKPNQ